MGGLKTNRQNSEQAKKCRVMNWLWRGSQTAHPARSDKAPRRILVVDDNRDSAVSLALLLDLGGHEAQTAHDSLEAVTAAERFRPDVVLLDIKLPKLNGFEVARMIRQQAWSKEVVLVALTGLGNEDDKQRSHDAGSNHHLVKPMDPAALENLIAKPRPK
jgi:DNA-binding response OmpR family regulator